VPGHPPRLAHPATGEFTALEYSTPGFLHSVADALGNKTYYWYNNVGNLQTISEELSGRINYQYDDNDNLTLVADEYGNKTSMTYDETTDLLVSMSYGKETKRYEYYEDGRLKRYTSPDRLNFDYTYDEQGNVTADGTNNYTYDAHSRLTSVVQDEKQLSFTYDGFNRITGIRYNDFSNNEVHYRYDANGKTTDLTYPDGKNVHYDYDGLNRLTAMTDWKGRTIRYSYDRDSRLTRTDYPNGMHTTYAYDAGGRLAQKKTVLRNGTTVAGYDFEYDLRGNIKKQLSTEPYEAAEVPNETTEYLYWGTNQLSRVDNADVLFDQNGNMMWGAGKYKSWDKNNRLVGIGDTRLQYDPLGNLRRYKNTNFLLDLSGIGHIIGEADDEGHPTRYYLHGTNLEARIARDGSTQYYVTDVRGSIVAMVDEAGLTLRQLMRQARKRIEIGGSVIVISVETFFEFIGNSPNVFRLLLRESSGTSQEFRTAAAREIKHFVDELAEYLAQSNHYSQYMAYVQAEGMMTIVFTAGANALDMNHQERELLKERVILQLRMLAKGGFAERHKYL